MSILLLSHVDQVASEWIDEGCLVYAFDQPMRRPCRTPAHDANWFGTLADTCSLHPYASCGEPQPTRLRKALPRLPEDPGTGYEVGSVFSARARPSGLGVCRRTPSIRSLTSASRLGRHGCDRRLLTTRCDGHAGVHPWLGPPMLVVSVSCGRLSVPKPGLGKLRVRHARRCLK